MRLTIPVVVTVECMTFDVVPSVWVRERFDRLGDAIEAAVDRAMRWWCGVEAEKEDER